MAYRKNSTIPSTSKDRTKWELLARQGLPEQALAMWYERAGKYQYSAGMPEEEADKRAFMELVRYER
jgi:predicted transcriptional regulator YdeE